MSGIRYRTLVVFGLLSCAIVGHAVAFVNSLIDIAAGPFLLFGLSIFLVFSMSNLAGTQRMSEAHPVQKLVYCLFYFAAIFEIILWFAAKYVACGIIYTGPEKADALTRADALYFSVVTWTTLGYGDFIPSAACRPWAAAEALIGYAMMAIFIVMVVALLQRRPASR